MNAVLYEASGQPRLPGLAAEPASMAANRGDSERRLLRGVLNQNPAEVAALLMLAREHERGSDAPEAAKGYRLAVRLAPLDRDVLAAAARFALRQGEVGEGLGLIGRLAEFYPEARGEAFPVMEEILTSRRDPAAWSEIAQRNPAWIGPFIVTSCRRGVDPGFLVPLASKRLASGAARDEAACLTDRLRTLGRWDEAYQVWLNTLPRERLADVGYVFNGSFEFPASGIGFDWMAQKLAPREAGHAVETTQTPGVAGKRALRVAYNGKRQAGSAIAQFLAAPPGRYELAGLARPDRLRPGRGVHWTLRCVEQGKPGPSIAQSERFVGSSEWRRFTFDVEIPPACVGQLLQLEPVGSEESAAFVEGTAWFDDLVLRRRG